GSPPRSTRPRNGPQESVLPFLYRIACRDSRTPLRGWGVVVSGSTGAAAQPCSTLSESGRGLRAGRPHTRCHPNTREGDDLSGAGFPDSARVGENRDATRAGFLVSRSRPSVKPKAGQAAASHVWAVESCVNSRIIAAPDCANFAHWRGFSFRCADTKWKLALAKRKKILRPLHRLAQTVQQLLQILVALNKVDFRSIHY